MSTRPANFGKFATACMIGMFLLIGGNQPRPAYSQPQTATIDDGWRRTKFGWENIRDWDLLPEQRELSSSMPIAPAVLSPTMEHLLPLLHPLAISVAICVLAVGVLQSPSFIDRRAVDD